MSTEHTPGPWNVSKNGTPDYAPQYGIHADGERDHITVTGANALANARLVAVAPDMLELLRDTLDVFNAVGIVTSAAMKATLHPYVERCNEVIARIERD